MLAPRDTPDSGTQVARRLWQASADTGGISRGDRPAAPPLVRQS